MSRYHKRHKQQPRPKTVAGPGPSQPTSRPRVAPSRCVTLAPLAPVIVRSGRPFDGQAGVDAARLPPPSTLAGCLRTAWARATGTAFSLELARHGVAGPLLLRDDAVLVPRPADALYFGHGAEARCRWAAPRPFADGCGADLPEGLLPVQLTGDARGKPGVGPAWWALEDWLAFRRGEVPEHAGLSVRGWSPLAGDRRTHVAIGTQGAAEDGKLFQTEGLDLGEGLDRSGKASSGVRLLARFAEPLGHGLAHLGGERRLAALHPEPEDRWPGAPDGWLDSIARAGGLSLTLATPALFAAGYRPGWLDDALTGTPPGAPGLRLRLRAAAVERWQPHSGWDLARWQPRPTRKLIPAGAVYWLEILEPVAPEALRPLWLSSLCDAEQDRRDGFGLALPAPWTPA
jgi:CRISPR-associated protein Cmr3